MKFLKNIYKTALNLAVERGNLEIVGLFLSVSSLDPNVINILHNIFFLNRIFMSNHSMKF